MAEAITIAVVGHTNAGKTSLLRTLTRRRGFGEVSDRPGTTRHVEAVELASDEGVVLRFLDTPGLEDPIGLLDALGPLRADMTPPQRIRALLATRAPQAEFEQEAKVLRALLDVDAALFVVDSREPVVAKFRCEAEILASCGKPVLPVLNFVRDPSSREADWRTLLADFALHAQVRFDAVAPFDDGQAQLYAALQALLPQRQGALRTMAAFVERERDARREAGLRVVADTLLGLAARRATVAREDLAEPGRRQRSSTPSGARCCSARGGPCTSCSTCTPSLATTPSWPCCPGSTGAGRPTCSTRRRCATPVCAWARAQRSAPAWGWWPTSRWPACRSARPPRSAPPSAARSARASARSAGAWPTHCRAASRCRWKTRCCS